MKKLDPDTYYRISLLIAVEICTAIEFAHKSEIMHRDIKPLNVFLAKHGVTKLGDFGLARFIDAVTRTHTVQGLMSAPYAAPEQWLGKEITVETDLYQLGCTLYELFTGQLPFNTTSVALLNAHLNEKPTTISELNPKIPSDLSQSIHRLMGKETSERGSIWQIVDSLLTELHGRYEITLDVTNESKAVQELVEKITDLDITQRVQFQFPSFHEVLSEGLQLVLSGFTEFKIDVLISDNYQAEIATTSS